MHCAGVDVRPVRAAPATGTKLYVLVSCAVKRSTYSLPTKAQISKIVRAGGLQFCDFSDKTCR